MTPTRYRECLAALHWTQRGLATVLDCSDNLTRGWASGRSQIPQTVATWLEALAAAHLQHPTPHGWQKRPGRAA